MARRKRILVSYATAGAGHKKAALAIKKALDAAGGDAEVTIIDSLDYMTAFFRWTYPRIYIFLVNRIPRIWGVCYYMLDNKVFYGLVSWIRHLTNWLHSRRLESYLAGEDFDVIVSTHFLLNDVVSMAGKKRIGSYLINVMTDFRPHSFWYASGADMYVVAHESAKRDLMKRCGVAGERIQVLGIPIDTVFSERKDRARLGKALGIDGSVFTVLVGSGGFGVGPIAEIIRSFKGISVPVQLLVVCGKNNPLCMLVTEMSEDIGIPVKAYGFIDNMDELMEASDVIVTKTGGMMSSEALSKGLPIVAIAPIPGQETKNFEVLSEIGVAIEGREAGDIPRIIEKLYNDPAGMKRIKDRIESVKRPDAARDIARHALAAR
jgi:processive 1,2-diacylglycerol beta-glucosyltransferase